MSGGSEERGGGGAWVLPESSREELRECFTDFRVVTNLRE
jgi:hypothetical protein